MILAGSPLLQSFENLGSLSEESGLFTVKPFYDWVGTSWSKKKFKMRLCNAGEILDIQSETNSVPDLARTQANKIEIAIRAVFSIDGKELITAEDLQTYNEKNRLQLTRQEFLRGWARNLEQVVLDRLDAVYGSLQLTQIRKLQQLSMCIHCAQAYREIPEGSRVLEFSFAEIICPTCLNDSSMDQSIYDFKEVRPTNPLPEAPPAASTPAVPASETSFGDTHSYICGTCQRKDFESFEEFTAHRETCETGAGASPSV